MALVVLADDAYVFMVMWETMALSSFFLVTANHRIPEIRRAGYLYLLVAHVGAIAILLCFGVLQARHRRLHLRQHARAAVDAVLGARGLPAGPVRLRRQGGMLPLHVWLPEAHPGRAFAGVGLDERRDAEDRGLRRAAGHLRLAAHPDLVVGGLLLGLGTGDRAVRGGVRGRANGHEAPAGLLLDREHRPAVCRHRLDGACSPPTA